MEYNFAYPLYIRIKRLRETKPQCRIPELGLKFSLHKKRGNPIIFCSSETNVTILTEANKNCSQNEKLICFLISAPSLSIPTYLYPSTGVKNLLFQNKYFSSVSLLLLFSWHEMPSLPFPFQLKFNQFFKTQFKFHES